MKKLPFIIE